MATDRALLLEKSVTASDCVMLQNVFGDILHWRGGRNVSRQRSSNLSRSVSGTSVSLYHVVENSGARIAVF